MTTDVGCVLLTGNGPSPRDGGWAFSSGGDQRIRGKDGYRYADGDEAATIDPARTGRLHILEVQRLIRFMPKVVIAVVPGWAAGGGHSLHVVCDLTLASREHARFKQTDADVASFDGGFGSAYLARQVGQKFAREVFFLGRDHSAEDAYRMGMVNAVVDHADLEREALEWARVINGKSPTALRMLKFGFNLIDDGLVGQQVFAGEATRLAYMTDEAAEGRESFLAKRDPDWSGFPLPLLKRQQDSPCPSSPAKGPHSLGAVHTCSIGGVGSSVPDGRQRPFRNRPTTCPFSSQHRSWWSCQVVSSPAMSGTSAIVLPGARMYMADTICLVPSSSTWNTIDSTRAGSSSTSSARKSKLTKCSNPVRPSPIEL